VSDAGAQLPVNCLPTSPDSVVPAEPKENQWPAAAALSLPANQATPDVTRNDRTADSAGCLKNLLFELGIEPTLTVHEAAGILRWSYWKARRYFSQVDGICVSYRPKRYKRPYRTFTIPVSIIAHEWQKMTGHEPESAEVIRHRLAVAIRK
jgi:hypothetical protein